MNFTLLSDTRYHYSMESVAIERLKLWQKEFNGEIWKDYSFAGGEVRICDLPPMDLIHQQNLYKISMSWITIIKKNQFQYF